MAPLRRPRGGESVLLLDVSSLVYRAYHAMPELTAPTGEPAGALYGFLAILLAVLRDRKPTHVFAAMDMPGKTFRHEAYTAYKATRPSIPPDLVVQLQRSREALEAYGIPVLAAAGYEADDTIATAVANIRATNPDITIEIVSGDADALQLVEKRTTVLAPRRGVRDLVAFTPESVREKIGVPPHLVPAFKALRGDPSDNIPGVRGIGEKTAAALLTFSGSLEKLLADAAALPPSAPRELQRFAQHLRDEAQTIVETQALVTLRTDAPIRVDLAAAARPETPPPAFLAFLKRFGFESLLQRVAPQRRSAQAAKVGHRTLEAFIREQEEQVRKDIDAAEASGAFSPEIAELERQLIPIISAMERHGVRVDRAALRKLRKRLVEEHARVAEDIYALAGHSFNLASPKQLGQVLFTELAIASSRKTAGGSRSTAAATLQALRGTHPIIERILRWREIAKLLTTYVDVLPKLIDPADGRIHAKFWQLGTVTGRIASSDPNLQNIPFRGEDGKAVRNVFVAPKGSVLLAADYVQIELRVAAALSRDAALIEIFRRGRDIHDETARRMFNVGEGAAVTREMRRRAKVLNFGILYGMGARRVAEELGVALPEAQAFLDEYRATFPDLARWMDDTKRTAERDGATTTAFGRKRFFPEFQTGNSAQRSAAERAAVNAPIQGTAADLVKRSMVAVARAVSAPIIIQVHDEIVFEVPRETLADTSGRVKAILEDVWPDAPVSFPVRLAAGEQWGALEELSSVDPLTGQRVQ